MMSPIVLVLDAGQLPAERLVVAGVQKPA